jgi:ribosomal protein L15
VLCSVEGDGAGGEGGEGGRGMAGGEDRVTSAAAVVGTEGSGMVGGAASMWLRSGRRGFARADAASLGQICGFARADERKNALHQFLSHIMRVRDLISESLWVTHVRKMTYTIDRIRGHSTTAL